MEIKELEQILKTVEKPSRYLGGEYNSPVLKKSGFNFCMCFPDVYEVGMSNLGIRIVSESINREQDMTADRCFAPWTDFGRAIKTNNIPLYSLGLKMPLKEFDMLGFSLQYEMCYTNVLYMLDLANIPLLASERGEDYPIIACGGPCAYNGEPLADFVDMFFIGDGEENVKNCAKLYKNSKNKQDFLQKCSKIDGVYIPSLMQVEYNDDGTIGGFFGITSVKKAIARDLDSAVFPNKIMVANTEAVHDRAVVEIMRGCYRGCRFCQAGYIYRPQRIKSADTVIRQSCALIEGSGFEELSLNSLSTGDYPELKRVIKGLKESLPNGTSLALPSLRVDSFEGDFADENRKSSLTFAPEAGSQRLRDVINKDITEEEVLSGIKQAFDRGYTSVKLYFMIGLPTETEEDLVEIRKLVLRIHGLYKALPKKTKPLRISVSASTFIPKPFTPFQWEAQASGEEIAFKQSRLKELLKIKGVNFSWSGYYMSSLEAVFARGDRRLGKVLLNAYKNGCIFDGWDELFNKDGWEKAFEQAGIDKSFYLREIGEDEILPWDYIDIFVEKDYLLKEKKRARGGEVGINCKKQCSKCGMQKVFKCAF